MTMSTEAPKNRYLTRHITYRLPIIGRIAREVVEGDEDTPFYAIALVLGLWGIAFFLFGYPGLIIPALMLVAVMMITLVRISLG